MTQKHSDKKQSFALRISGAILILFLSYAISGCDRSRKDAMARAFESEDRAAWQKPEEILARLGDLQGKTVADLGSASGYFTVRLARSGARVLSLDVDEEWIRRLKSRLEEKENADIRDLISVRKIPEDRPGLMPEEIDHLLCVDTYHHLPKENRVRYLKQIRAALKPDGKLVIIDFRKMERPVGPPPGHGLVDPDTVRQEIQDAGFTILEEPDILPYQYFFLARK